MCAFELLKLGKKYLYKQLLFVSYLTFVLNIWERTWNLGERKRERNKGYLWAKNLLIETLIGKKIDWVT